MKNTCAWHPLYTSTTLYTNQYSCILTEIANVHLGAGPTHSSSRKGVLLMRSNGHPISRRKLLKTAGAGTAGMLLSGHTSFAETPESQAAKTEPRAVSKSAALTGDAGKDLTLVAVTPRMLRITVAAVGENVDTYYDDGSLVSRTYPAPLHRQRADTSVAPNEVAWGEYTVRIESEPLRLSVRHPKRGNIQELTFHLEKNQVLFQYGN